VFVLNGELRVLIRPSGQATPLSFRQYLNGDRLELPRLAPAGLHFISHPLTLTQLIDVIRALCDVNEHIGTARIRRDKSIALIDVKIDDGTGSSGHSLLLAQRQVADLIVASGSEKQLESHRREIVEALSPY
jgi:hypothetical protein